MQWPAHIQPTHARWEVVSDTGKTSSDEKSGRLPELDPVFGRNFRIHDLCLESAPESWLGNPGSETDDRNLSSISADILEELSPEELIAFEDAKTREANWRGKWHTERFDGLRAHILPSVEWFPK